MCVGLDEDVRVIPLLVRFNLNSIFKSENIQFEVVIQFEYTEMSEEKVNLV